jgi:hypothetical protein
MKKMIYLLPILFLIFFSCKQATSADNDQNSSDSPVANYDPNPLIAPGTIDATNGGYSQIFQLVCSSNPDSENLYDEDGDAVTVVVDSNTPLPDCMTLVESTGVLLVTRDDTVDGTINFWTVDDRGGSTESEPLTVSYDISPAPSASGEYIAGFYTDTTGVYYTVACYWKDGAIVELYNVAGNDAEAQSIFIDGVDVYVSGYYTSSGTKIACYWKNGTRVDLYTSGTISESDALSIAVEASFVYIAGFYVNGSGYNSCYWKNPSSESSSTSDSLNTLMTAVSTKAESVFVLGGTVYIAGYYSTATHYIPCYWVNNSDTITSFSLDDGVLWGYATSISVSKNIVYIAGHQGTKKSCYWTDDDGEVEQIDLDTSDFAQAYSLSILETDVTDVYISGRYHDNTDGVKRACYWKNNSSTKVILEQNTSTDSSANSIFLTDSDTYIAGYDVETSGSLAEAAIYWNSDGSFAKETLYNSSKAESNCIFVVE